MSSNVPHRINLSRMWWLVERGREEQKKLWCDLATILENPSSKEGGTTIRLARNFNCPSQLTADSRVFLYFQNMPTGLQYFFNEYELGAPIGSDLRWEISGRVKNHNRIDIVGECEQREAMPVDQPPIGNSPKLWLELTSSPLT